LLSSAELQALQRTGIRHQPRDVRQQRGFHLDAADSTVRPALTQVLNKGVDWEQQAITSDGTIQVAGNSRVFCGGEQFLGKQEG
jgi:hypothetical protein